MIAVGLRLDRSISPLSPPRSTPEGVLLEGRAARTGEHSYPWGVERRDAAELARIAEQLPGVPVVLRHPASGYVADDTPRAGHVVTARIDGDHVVCDLLITDAAVVLDVVGGVRELSLGYEVRVDADGWQRDTKIDHLALVERARCGETCAVRVDCASSSACGCGGACARGGRMLNQTAHRGQPMDPEELKKQIAALEAEREIAAKRADAAEAELDTARTRIAALEGERDAERTRADAAERARNDAATAQPEQVRARVKLERDAAAWLHTDGKPDDLSTLSDRAIKCAVVKRADNFDVPSDKPDAYVDARFDAVVGRPNPLAGLVSAAVTGRRPTDALEIPDADAAAARMRADTDNAWKRSSTEVK